MLKLLDPGAYAAKRRTNAAPMFECPTLWNASILIPFPVSPLAQPKYKTELAAGVAMKGVRIWETGIGESFVEP